MGKIRVGWGWGGGSYISGVNFWQERKLPMKRLPQCSPTRNCKFLPQIRAVHRAGNLLVRPFLVSGLGKLPILFDLVVDDNL